MDAGSLGPGSYDLHQLGLTQKVKLLWDSVSHLLQDLRGTRSESCQFMTHCGLWHVPLMRLCIHVRSQTVVMAYFTLIAAILLRAALSLTEESAEAGERTGTASKGMLSRTKAARRPRLRTSLSMRQRMSSCCTLSTTSLPRGHLHPRVPEQLPR